MRAGFLALAMVAVVASEASAAEWQIKPFVGLKFRGETTFVENDLVAGDTKLCFGGNVLVIGEVLGVEGDFNFVPGYFNGGHLVVASSVSTWTANVVLAMPARLSRYTLRPYVVGGGGMMHVHIDDFLGALIVLRNLATVDIGGGATGFISDRVGVNWDVRYFHSIGGTDHQQALSIGPEQLSFWRATMAVALKY